MKIIGLGGLPAAGKSTIVKNIIKSLGKHKIFKYGTVRGEFYEPNIYVLGKYDRKFGGTDTLSMAVQPHAERFIKNMKDKEIVILYEGDRLFNRSFIKKIIDTGINHSLYMIIADPDIIDKRHSERGDTQSEQWIKGRKTKYNKIYSAYADVIKLLRNNNEIDLKSNMEIIWRDLKNII